MTPAEFKNKWRRYQGKETSAYARVPGDVRSLVVQEQVGSFYFGVLAQFAGVVTIMLS